METLLPKRTGARERSTRRDKLFAWRAAVSTRAEILDLAAKRDIIRVLASAIPRGLILQGMLRLIMFYRRRIKMKGVILRCAFLTALQFSAGLAVSAHAEAKQPITFDDMIRSNSI